MDVPCSNVTVLRVQHYIDFCLETLPAFVNPVNFDPRVLTMLDRHVAQPHPHPPLTGPVRLHRPKTLYDLVIHRSGSSIGLKHLHIRKCAPPHPRAANGSQPQAETMTVMTAPPSFRCNCTSIRGCCFVGDDDHNNEPRPPMPCLSTVTTLKPPLP